ncbi:hypothetical protein DFH07DRAFT_1066105 [Mycena maculata]|uniref:F-box domain-containing protein n=1 Tax=Mycena maculata TaxID=230809 RepID=A0AAD7HXZ0_9AGAR|nr:hypothetical protein DFH07DRAFT_1066105 [Mycena maculata]
MSLLQSRDSNSAVSMLHLPNELLDIILSLLDTEELWFLMQVCSHFQPLVLLPLLSRYGIGLSDIESGIVTLPGMACHLIPRIYDIRPIHRLTIGPPFVPSSLTSVLAATPPIPDLQISDVANDRQTIAGLITAWSPDLSNTIVFLRGGTMRLSVPRNGPPIRWKFFSGWPRITRYPTTSDIIFTGVGLIALPFTGLINTGVLVAWIYRRAFGPKWDHNARVTALLHSAHGHSIRLQAVSVPGAEDLTLITYDSALYVGLTIAHNPALTNSHYSALLDNWDLGYNLMIMSVGTGCSFIFRELMQFVLRHPNLKILKLAPNSIDAASVEIPFPTTPGRMSFLLSSGRYIPYITDIPVGNMSRIPPLSSRQRYIPRIFRPNKSSLISLSSPPLYIPHILRLQPCVRTLSVQWEERPGGKDSDFHRRAYSRVITAIATLPRPCVEILNLHFSSTINGPALPWHTDPGEEARLTSVTRLQLFLDGGLSEVDIWLLPRWLARFPALIRVDFCTRAVPPSAQAALARAISAARLGDEQWQGVHFIE